MLENKGNFERIYPPERFQDPGEPYELFRRKAGVQASVDLRKNHSLWRFNRIASLGEKAGLFDTPQALNEERQTPKRSKKQVYHVSLSRVLKVNNQSALLKSKIDTINAAKKKERDDSEDTSNNSSVIEEVKKFDKKKKLRLTNNTFELPKMLTSTPSGFKGKVK